MGKVKRLRQKYNLSCQKSGKQPTTSQPIAPVKLPTDSNLLAVDLKHLPKKGKRRLVREALLRRLGAVRKPEAKRHRKTDMKVIDMKSLLDSLPTVATSGDKGGQSSNHGSNGKLKKSKKAKASKEQFLKDVKQFKSFLSNSYYKADPASAISNYILRTVHK